MTQATYEVTITYRREDGSSFSGRHGFVCTAHAEKDQSYDDYGRFTGLTKLPAHVNIPCEDCAQEAESAAANPSVSVECNVCGAVYSQKRVTGIAFPPVVCGVCDSSKITVVA